MDNAPFPDSAPVTVRLPAPVTFKVVVPLGADITPDASKVWATRLMLPLVTVTLKPPPVGWMPAPWMVRSPPPVRVTLPPKITFWLALNVRLPWPDRLSEIVRLPLAVSIREVLPGPEPSELPASVNAWLLRTSIAPTFAAFKVLIVVLSCVDVLTPPVSVRTLVVKAVPVASPESVPDALIVMLPLVFETPAEAKEMLPPEMVRFPPAVPRVSVNALTVEVLPNARVGAAPVRLMTPPWVKVPPVRATIFTSPLERMSPRVILPLYPMNTDPAPKAPGSLPVTDRLFAVNTKGAFAEPIARSAVEVKKLAAPVTAMLEVLPLGTKP